MYGLAGLKKIAKVSPISQISYVFDSRFEAKILSIGTLKEKEYYSGEEQPIVFAMLGNGKYVGIINMSSSEIALVRGFRDVWKYGEEESEIQTISVLTEEEASKINNFSLYIYRYANSGIGRNKYQIEKYDRTFDKRFKFQLDDGSDYRLIKHTELFK